MRKLLFGLVPIIAFLLTAFGAGAAVRSGPEPVVSKDLTEFLSGAALAPDRQALTLQAVFAPGPALTALTRASASVPSFVVGTNVRVNAPQAPAPAGLIGRSETTIAADEEGENLVAGFNDAQGFCGPPFGAACTPQVPSGLSGFAFSTDGGATWTDGGAPNPALGFASVGVPVFTRGDPWLAADRDGDTFFYANLSVNPLNGADLGVSVHRGEFSGSSFAWNDVHVLPYPATDFADKEAIATDPTDADNAAVSLTNFQQLCSIPQNGFGQIEVWRTRDGGNTWQGPAIAGPEQPDSLAACGNAGTLQQSSVPAFGRHDRVFVTWQVGPTFSLAGVASTNAAIAVARSLDGGATFGSPVTVAAINSMRQNPPVGFNRSRINDHPRIAVATEGPFRDRVFVVFYSAVTPVASPSTVQSLVSSQVFISHSDNDGLTWSAPTAIAPAVPSTGVKRWWPVVTLEPDGDVNVVYYESQETQATAPPTDIECNVSIGGGFFRTGLNSSLVNTKLVHSDDGGVTFGAPITVSSATSNWCKVFSNVRPNFGDYIGSAAARKDGDDLILPVWADGRNTVIIGGVPRNVADTFFAPVVEDD